MINFTFDFLRPGYEDLWSKITAPGGITKEAEAHEQALAIVAPQAKSRFLRVEKMTAVPWFVTGIILTREAGGVDFDAWLHNGDPMRDRHGHPIQTRHVPAHRPPNPNCTWEAGAQDAYEYEDLIGERDWSPAFVAWLLEKYNGFGYREYHNIPSPYLWGGTVVQKPGKYVKDRQYDPNVMDPQIGGMALLAVLMQIDETAKFETKEQTA